jgi:polyhydroxybutyrate depolymerase
VVNDGTSVERRDYPRCTGGAAVQLYVIKGGGHTWPPRSPQVVAGGQATGNLDATRVIVDFFLP